MPSALKLHPKCPLGVDSASRLLPFVLVFLLFFCCEICWHFCPRFGEASLPTKETFEIPFLEKSVLPGRGPYSGFLVHTAGFWPVGTAPSLGFSLDPAWKNLLGRREKKAPCPHNCVCFPRPSFIVVLP